jgi:predicted acylesterase/phospholipase RssA
MWQVEGQKSDLERSLGYYHKAYEMGPEKDQGYTGINAAFVQDLLALENARQATKTGLSLTAAVEGSRRARNIRRRLVGLLPDLPSDPKLAWLKQEWWFYTTLAEAHFGLGEFDHALSALRSYNQAVGLAHHGPPLERIGRWELESTITQLVTLTQVQAELGVLLEQPAESPPEPSYQPVQWHVEAEQLLREYLGPLAPGVKRAISGKLGLALSGGGFRASLFHIGVLAFLAEGDLLRDVEVLSCVSGGSIVGAHYYLEVKRLLESKADHEITRDDYIEIVQRLERDFLAGVQTNIRSRAYASIWANLRAFLLPSYTTTRRLGELYESQLYSRVDDGRGDKPRHLPDLFVNPPDEKNFQPKYDNWRRRAKVPTLVLNATTLNSGHNWQFTASWMGEPPSSIDAEIDGNYRLRRMYYWQAPRLKDRWRHWLTRPFAPPNYQRFRLGDAVAASSCVPGLFEPLLLPGLYDGKTVRLVDGGVYDNQGTASLLEQDCTALIVSDASGQAVAQDYPGGRRVGVLFRSFGISMSRVRQSQYREMSVRYRSGLLKERAFLHLRKDLDSAPVDWYECQDPYNPLDEGRPKANQGVLTRYRIQKQLQRLVSAIRTDLDSFTEVEAFALMTSGYRQAQMISRDLPGLADAGPAVDWRFLRIEPALSPGPGYEEVQRQLRIGAMTAGKVWRLYTPLRALGFVAGVAALFGIFQLWAANQDYALVTVGGLGIFLFGLAVTLAVPHLARWIRYKQTFRDAGLRSALMTLLAIGFKLHLWVFDPLFLRLGRLERLLKRRSSADA